MLNEENKELCQKVLGKYGMKSQLMMVMEECAELVQAISKLFRYEKTSACEQYERANFAFVLELVDVIVMCQQMVLALGYDMDLINELAKPKLEKALKGSDGNAVN